MMAKTRKHSADVRRNSSVGLRAEIQRNGTLYLMALPALLAVLVFNYGPLFGLVIAFQDFSPFRGVLGSDWVGLGNFSEAVNNPFFWPALRNSLTIAGLKLALGFPTAIVLALMLNEVRIKWFKVTVQTASMMPFLISWVVAGMIFRAILSSDGLLNDLRRYTFGLEPISFLSDAGRFLWVIILQDIWKYAGYYAVLYLAAISSIDPALYEAAEMDGANRWQQTRFITLPGISNTMVTLLLISVGYLISAGFEQLYVMGSASVYSTGDILETFTLRLGLSQGNYGLATAVGLFQGAISLLLVLSANAIAKRVRGAGLF
jgi:ABC-type polysaccharide transport system permease subunit